MANIEFTALIAKFNIVLTIYFMRFAPKLAWKYFRSSRKGLTRFTSVVVIIGICAGVASLIVAQALSKGFADEMRDKVLGNTAHISVSQNGDTRISNWEIIKRKLEGLDAVKEVETTAYESAVISNGATSTYAVLRVKDLKNQDQPGAERIPSPGSVSVLIGKELAEKLNLKVKGEAKILVAGEDEKPSSENVAIAGIFETGLYEYDSTWVYISSFDYRALKNQESFSPSAFTIYLNDIFQSRQVADQIREILGSGFKVIDWQEANKPLFAALSLERKVSFAIIFIIIFISALNITTTLALLINERKVDIAILKTCGARTKNLVSIFLFEGIILSLIGIIAGTILGFLACYIGNRFRVVSLSKQVYSLNYVPFHPEFLSVAIILSLTLLLCTMAMIYPLIKVSKIKPLEIIRRS